MKLTNTWKHAAIGSLVGLAGKENNMKFTNTRDHLIGGVIYGFFTAIAIVNLLPKHLMIWAAIVATVLFIVGTILFEIWQAWKVIAGKIGTMPGASEKELKALYWAEKKWDCVHDILVANAAANLFLWAYVTSVVNHL